MTHTCKLGQGMAEPGGTQTRAPLAVPASLATAALIGFATGLTTATIPAHIAGDAIIAYCFNSLSTTLPTTPSGWTNLAASSLGTLCRARVIYIMAVDDATTLDSVVNCTHVILVVLRGTPTPPYGGLGQRSNTVIPDTANVQYNTVAMVVSTGASRILLFAGCKEIDRALETVPPGTILVGGLVSVTGEVAAFITPDGVTSWALTDPIPLGGTPNGWVSTAIEAKAA